jgi:CheY-like chemotaxis protein
MSDRRPTILVVDDHSDLRDALVVLLEHEGYRVADASNGAEALGYLRSDHPVDALIVDLDMPVMNGWEFLAACRQHPTWRAIPTVVFTGMSVAERRRDELGSLPVFTKPVNFDHLLTALRRAMIRPIDPDPALGHAH